MIPVSSIPLTFISLVPESKMNQIDEISERLRELQQDITRRKDRWTAMRAFLEKKTPRKFDEMLNLNQYSGTLEFSHEFKSLDLVVQKGVNGGRTTDVKGLRQVVARWCSIAPSYLTS